MHKKVVVNLDLKIFFFLFLSDTFRACGWQKRTENENKKQTERETFFLGQSEKLKKMRPYVLRRVATQRTISICSSLTFESFMRACGFYKKQKRTSKHIGREQT